VTLGDRPCGRTTSAAKWMLLHACSTSTVTLSLLTLPATFSGLGGF
jgi:hypothetical protein